MFSRSTTHPTNIVSITASLLLCLTTLGFCDDVKKPDKAEETSTSKNTSAQIDQLIEQLGNDSYAEREQAETKLLEFHMEAFEPLIRARKHADPEIAARARYLTRQIQVNFVMPGDSPQVAKLMRNIFTLDHNKKEQQIQKLSMLPDGEGLSALCRLVRFSESELSAKTAAVNIIKSRLYSKEDLVSIGTNLPTSYPRPASGYMRINVQQTRRFYRPMGNQSLDTKTIGKPLGQKERDEVRRLLKSCDRPATSLIFTWFDLEEAKTDAKKRAAYDKWDKLCQKEEKIVRFPPISANKKLFLSLLMTQIEKAVELKLDEKVQVGLIKRQLQQSNYWTQTQYQEITERLINEKAWKLAGISIPEFGTILMQAYYQDTLPRFFCILIRSGKEKVGDELFELYLKIFTQHSSIKANYLYRCAKVLTQEGLYDRATVQLEAAIKADKDNLKRSRNHERQITWYSYQELIDLQEGLEQYDLAAKTSDRMHQTLTALTKKQKRHPKIADHLKSSKSQTSYYRAMAEKKKGNEAAYRKLLEEAMKSYPESGKALIECYNIPAVTPISKKFHDRIIKQINKTVASRIKQAESRKNQEVNANWAAWLVANTEGDLDAVIKLLESIRIPDSKYSSGILDTLALCYYKKGDVEKAISLQRKSLEQAPHDRRFKEAWATFSTAYEKKTGKKPEPPKSGPERYRILLGLPPK